MASKLHHQLLIYLYELYLNYSDSGKILPTKLQFRLQNIKCSKVDGNKLIHLAVIILPASENNRSLVADIAGIARYFFANCDKIGKRNS